MLHFLNAIVCFYILIFLFEVMNSMKKACNTYFHEINVPTQPYMTIVRQTKKVHVCNETHIFLDHLYVRCTVTSNPLL